jgi:N-acetylneuraminate synthase
MLNPYIEIRDRKIGKDYPPVVIAEIGINHGGSLKVAKEMVDAAFKAGAEIVKHQTHIIEDEMTKESKKVIPGNSNTSIYEIMATCALDENDELDLKKYVESLGMIFISTPFSRAAANRLNDFDVPAFKIGSGECNNYPLLKHIAQFKKPVILSTGMNDIRSVRKAVDIFDEYKVPIALLHTTNLYPTPTHLVRFGAMLELSKEFPSKVFGLSDHTLNNNACLGATALGASILERHFTDNMFREGPDIICSMDQASCKNLILSSKEIWSMRGGVKKATKEEKVTMDFAFATVCSITKLFKGDILTKKNIWVKRPGTGEIPAEEYGNILGKVINRNIDEGEHLSYKDLK